MSDEKPLCKLCGRRHVGWCPPKTDDELRRPRYVILYDGEPVGVFSPFEIVVGKIEAPGGGVTRTIKLVQASFHNHVPEKYTNKTYTIVNGDETYEDLVVCEIRTVFQSARGPTTVVEGMYLAGDVTPKPKVRCLREIPRYRLVTHIIPKSEIIPGFEE